MFALTLASSWPQTSCFPSWFFICKMGLMISTLKCWAKSPRGHRGSRRLCPAPSRWPAWGCYFGGFHQGSEGLGSHSGSPPPSLLRVLSQNPTGLSVSPDLPDPTLPQNCLLLAPGGVCSAPPLPPHHSPPPLSPSPVHSRGRPVCLRVPSEIPDHGGGAAAGPDQETYPFPEATAGQGAGQGTAGRGEGTAPLAWGWGWGSALPASRWRQLV